MDIMDQVKKGTTTIGLICGESVVLASEKRATMGSFIASKTAKKIYLVDDRIAMTTAGIVGDAQALVRIMTVELQLYKIRRNEPMTVKGISTLLSNVMNGQRYYPYIVQLLIGGIDRDGAHLYTIDPFGGNTEESEIAATGSGSPIAYGVLENNYRKDISLEKGTALAIQALYSAIKRDSASGEAIEVVTITKDRYESLSEEKIKGLRTSS
uniref:Proteasome subunit beta n=1 Tax=Candidatus Methanophaga sp. ANME-1 ERB7 TaxID=2759913 RepID=A0A7G9Z6Y8_9EURY|nr:proteasome subunit beta [Methanosarcinales archaeon ANME-1 ERB7]QNO56022.1 proteasome subunit beta [Methanosarcinales archaeon ANME-1 ERB7]QNO57132.1 proteasome subunit beta [Methanosarcinales archaeon ANME-1 ERB7]